MNFPKPHPQEVLFTAQDKKAITLVLSKVLEEFKEWKEPGTAYICFQIWKNVRATLQQKFLAKRFIEGRLSSQGVSHYSAGSWIADYEPDILDGGSAEMLKWRIQWLEQLIKELKD